MSAEPTAYHKVQGSKDEEGEEVADEEEAHLALEHGFEEEVEKDDARQEEDLPEDILASDGTNQRHQKIQHQEYQPHDTHSKQGLINKISITIF